MIASFCGEVMRKRKTHEKFILELYEVNPNVEVIEKYVNSKTKILCKCKIDGHEWYTTPSRLLEGKGCPICGNKTRSIRLGKLNSGLKTMHELFVNELFNINKNIEVIGTYIGSMTKIECKCKIDEHVWSSTPNNLLSGHGCPLCARRRNPKLQKKTHEQFIKELEDINPNIEILSQYDGTHSKIKCRCKKDDHTWYTTPHNLLTNKNGCPKCKISKGEDKICLVLNSLCIEYIEQYRFENCRNKRPLPFDFYLPNYNMCIEYQGGQHYFSVDYFGGSSRFEEQQKKDDIKRDYCKTNNIKLIEIPYWEFDNIEDIIRKNTTTY